MKHARVAAALLVPLLLTLPTGCGDGDGDDESGDGDDPTTSATGTPEEQAITETLVQSLLDPRCDLLTDEYLLEISLFGAETVDEACEERMQSWVEPQYDEDDIVVSDIEVTGDTATAVIGDNFSNVTTIYELMLVDGTWKVSCEEFNCDDLEPSPEVS